MYHVHVCICVSLSSRPFPYVCVAENIEHVFDVFYLRTIEMCTTGKAWNRGYVHVCVYDVTVLYKCRSNNPATFRDLSKPIGALNEERLAFFKVCFVSLYLYICIHVHNNRHTCTYTFIHVAFI